MPSGAHIDKICVKFPIGHRPSVIPKHQVYTCVAGGSRLSSTSSYRCGYFSNFSVQFIRHMVDSLFPGVS